MASPFIAGLVALLFEKNNTLTLSQIRTALQAGVITEGLTSKTTDPANSYGAGKVDGVAVLSSVGEDTSAYSGTGDLESPSGGGCQLTSSAKPNASILFIFLPLLALLIPRILKKYVCYSLSGVLVGTEIINFGSSAGI